MRRNTRKLQIWRGARGEPEKGKDTQCVFSPARARTVDVRAVEKLWHRNYARDGGHVIFRIRRGARVVDRDRLEICCTLTSTVGSNPTLSANKAKGPFTGSFALLGELDSNPFITGQLLTQELIDTVSLVNTMY